MSEVAVITLGYYNYVVSDDFIATLVGAAAEGKIKTATTKQVNGEKKVILGKSVDISAERLEVVSDREAELAELKDKLKKLEAL